MVLGLAAGQGATKVAGGVAGRDLVGHGVAEHLTDELQRAVRLFIILGGFEGPHGVEDFNGLDFVDRSIAQAVLNKADEPFALAHRRHRQAVALVLGDIVFGDGAESVDGGDLGRPLVAALLVCGVYPVGHLGAGAVPQFAGVLQADLRIAAERKLLLKSNWRAKFHAPKAAAGCRDLEVKAFFVGDLIVLVAGLQRADGGVGQSHLGAFFQSQFDRPPQRPPFSTEYRRTMAAVSVRPRGQYTRIYGVFQSPAHIGDQVDGAAYRTRTCDPLITNEVLYQLS